MDIKTLTYLARISWLYGDTETAEFFGNLWEEAWEENGVLKYLDTEREWMKNSQQKIDKITELREELSEDWIRDRRMEYLDHEIRKIVYEIESFEENKRRSKEWFLFDQELKNLEKKYKSFFLEYSSLHSYDTEKDKIDDAVIQQCREIPIDSFFSSPPKDVGGGRKKTLCPFHEEKDGSFVIYPDNSFYCFGCGAFGGNAIDFVMKKNNLNFIKAINFLRRS